MAVESGELGNGLLSYALVEEALEPGRDGQIHADTNADGAVTISEWLGYAERRVPGIYQDLISGVLEPREVDFDDEHLTDTARHAQTPVLFDFAKPKAEEIRLPVQ